MSIFDQIFVVFGVIGALVAFARRPGAIGAGMLLAGFGAGVAMSIILN
jgi:hypothetical protein